MLMPSTVVDDAAVAGERLGTAVRDLALLHGGAPGTPVVTVTVGVAGWVPGEAPADVLERSSQAAFAAKAEGQRGTVPPGAPSRRLTLRQTGRSGRARLEADGGGLENR